MKQENLAEKLGTNQQAVSRLEQKETMDTKNWKKLRKRWVLLPKPLKPLMKKRLLQLLIPLSKNSGQACLNSAKQERCTDDGWNGIITEWNNAVFAVCIKLSCPML
jgi:transcriptional regulator with XRE-family HTH domain